jgi:PhzF family phenazine biosynthesis protein
VLARIPHFIEVNYYMANVMTVYLVDAFTLDGKGGSPTGVLLQASDLHETQMRKIARQLSCSHTAFVTKVQDGSKQISVRFFTAGGEIANCGHGSIALHYCRAKLHGSNDASTLEQRTSAGSQVVEIRKGKKDLEVYLHQNPIWQKTVEASVIESLCKALLITPEDLDKSYSPALASPGAFRFLLPVKSLQILNAINPDFDQLKTVCFANDCMGCFVYAGDPSNKERFFARMFYPFIGVNEDIINGNSSGCLAAYLLSTGSSNHIMIETIQGHLQNCTGLVKVHATRQNDIFKSIIGGEAVIRQRVEISLD